MIRLATMPSSAGRWRPFIASGFDALMVFHYTLTAINELREPLHDEVIATVLRVEGDEISPVDEEFERIVLTSEFFP